MKQKRYRFLEIIAIMIEKFAYAFSDAATVSSFHSKDYIVSKYNLDSNDINVLFNYIDIDLNGLVNLYQVDLKRSRKLASLMNMTSWMRKLVANFASCNRTFKAFSLILTTGSTT